MPGTAQDRLTSGRTRQSRVGGTWQEMAHRLENSSIDILCPLQSGYTSSSVLLILPASHSHTTTHTTQELSGNFLGTLCPSQRSILKEGILVGGIWRRGVSPAMRNPTSQHPLGAKPKAWVAIGQTPANQSVLTEPPLFTI